MTAARQRIVRERRQYNKWANSQTLEDYALRFTAQKARRWSAWRIANTAMGSIAFLACEAIGGTLTLAFGFANAATAIGLVCGLMFFIGLPIAYFAARYGLDIDLLTRGAGFGYMGSTITSLIYACFTFLLLAVEASIMSVALQAVFGIPLWLGHIISALLVIPIAIYGIRFISRMQLATQPIWVVLQIAPLIFLAMHAGPELAAWTQFTGERGNPDGGIDLMGLASASSILLALLPQIGEQADYLRFLPDRERTGRTRWWVALLTSGPGWVVPGGLKLLAGSFLVFFAIEHGVPRAAAEEPTGMFLAVFSRMVENPELALLVTGVFVVVCQLKINVTNGYAGSIAWSNFFSRLTHAHPGRVVWLVFNVVLALLLMLVGVLTVIENVLVLYANLAVAWIGALAADLVINKPLGYSPKGIEFKRAHLYDINPVGVGALALSIVFSTLALVGAFGPLAQALAPFIGLGVAFVATPLIAIATRGRYYIARPPETLESHNGEVRCTICENAFEGPDVAFCPAYAGPICSLCCTLETRCNDLCKTNSRFNEQITAALRRLLPTGAAHSVHGSIGHFVGILALFIFATGYLLSMIYMQYSAVAPESAATIRTTLWVVFFSLLVPFGIAAWLMVLAHESRRAAESESERQTSMLMDEIAAHERTDTALQQAKEAAEAANEAKSRYVVGISHEIRSPLNAIFGYAQLLERDPQLTGRNAVRVIRRSAEHLSNLVEGLLDISRIESGVARLSRDTVPIRELLEQIADMFRVQAVAKGIDFRFEQPDELPATVYTDQKRLRQILINLLSNAIKYTERGEVGLRVHYPSSEVAEFRISDSGMGIRADDVESIFEPFERGGMPGARALPGAGLGLAITRVLVQIMGGEILVRSQPGEGSTFTVRIRLPAASGARDERAQRRQVVGYEGPRRRILLVDDNPAHRELARSLLEPLDFDLVEAGEAASALQIARELKPDLAMLDIAMPGMDGWELAAALRALALPGLRIMMVSANAHDSHVGGGPDAVHDAFVMKPIDIDLLLERLGELLALQWRHQPTETDATTEGADAAEPPGAEAVHFLDALEQLGRIGYMRGIEAQLRAMEAEHPGTAAFAARLRGHLADYDLKGFLALLEAAKHHG